MKNILQIGKYKNNYTQIGKKTLKQISNTMRYRDCTFIVNTLKWKLSLKNDKK